MLERRLQVISDRLEGAPGRDDELLMGDGPHVRVLELRLDATARLDTRGLVQALMEDTPGIAVGSRGAPSTSIRRRCPTATRRSWPIGWRGYCVSSPASTRRG